MDNQNVVRALWQAFDDLDFEQAASLLHPGFVCDWPQSNERIRGIENYIAVNKFYPGQWRIKPMAECRKRTFSASAIGFRSRCVRNSCILLGHFRVSA